MHAPNTNEVHPNQAFAPLPLRPRGVLEILDVSIKAFRQYFWVLVGWAALANVVGLLTAAAGFIVPGASYIGACLTGPLVIGAAVCCIAAAVRGQKVELRQCWQFTKPRYWPLVGLYIVALIIAGMAMCGLMVICGLIAVGGYFLFRNTPMAAQIIAGIIGGVVLLTVLSVLMTVLYSWSNLVGIVVCMEDDKRNTRALARAYELLRGQWLQVTSLMMVLWLGASVLYGILAGTAVMLIGLPQLRGLFTGQPTNPELWGVLAGFACTSAALGTIFTPVSHLTLTLYYLDVRIRKEALDLEWTAHVTAPMPIPSEYPTNIAPGTTPGVIIGAASPFSSAQMPPAHTPPGAINWQNQTSAPASQFPPPLPQSPSPPGQETPILSPNTAIDADRLPDNHGAGGN